MLLSLFDCSSSCWKVFPFTSKNTHSASLRRVLISTTRSDSGDQAKVIIREPRSRWNSKSSPADSYVPFCSDQRQICNLHASWPLPALPPPPLVCWGGPCGAASAFPAEASVGAIMNSHCPLGLKDAKPGCTTSRSLGFGFSNNDRTGDIWRPFQNSNWPSPVAAKISLLLPPG